MCRIAGQIDCGNDVGRIVAAVQTMCDTLRHGGPDDEGIYTDDENHLVFGHRRLSIIGLGAGGHQPMTDTARRAWITFNGEIYNYPELKQELILRGARFHSETDTEVIIKAYLQWGEASFARLRGIFAFALYDKEKTVTYLVRDRSGVKPLYYQAENGRLSFASEVKALKQAGIAVDEDVAWRIRFLAFGHIPEPYTTLRNVQSLPKGHFLRWDGRRERCSIEPYNEQVCGGLVTSAAAARELVHTALKLSIKRQLIADAPIGVFLSGGIDSSLVTLLAAEQKKAQLKTISVFFNEKAYDESHFQQLVFNKIEGEKFTHLVRRDDFEAAFPRILDAMDMPTTDGINTWFISKYAHEDGLKAVLSGLGADELYGGYPSFNRIQYLKYLKNIPPALLRAVIATAPAKYKKLGYMAYKGVLADYLALRGFFIPPDIAAILDTDTAEVVRALFGDSQSSVAPRYDAAYAGWIETNLYMQNQLLRDTDVMSMSHALEVRVPFLDEDFISATALIPSAMKFDQTQGKKLLVDSFKAILPPEVWNRPKMGFTFPLQQWMRQSPQISDASLYRGSVARGIIKRFSDNTEHWSKAFALFQLQRNG